MFCFNQTKPNGMVVSANRNNHKILLHISYYVIHFFYYFYIFMVIFLRHHRIKLKLLYCSGWWHRRGVVAASNQDPVTRHYRLNCVQCRYREEIYFKLACDSSNISSGAYIMIRKYMNLKKDEDENYFIDSDAAA